MEKDLLDLLSEANLDDLDDICADTLPDVSWLLWEGNLQNPTGLEDEFLTPPFTPSSTSDSSQELDEDMEIDVCSIEPEENAKFNLEPRRERWQGKGCASKNLCHRNRQNERERERRAKLKKRQLRLQGLLHWKDNERSSLREVLQKAIQEINRLEEERERLDFAWADAFTKVSATRTRFGRARALVYGYKLHCGGQKKLAEAERKSLSKREYKTNASDGKQVKSKKKRSQSKKYDRLKQKKEKNLGTRGNMRPRVQVTKRSSARKRQ